MDCEWSDNDSPYTLTQALEEDRLLTLVKVHYFPLLSYAHRRCRTAGAAEDVITQTFLYAWRHIGEVPEGDETFPWLLRVARRLLAERRRGEALRLRVLDRLRERGGDPGRRSVLDHPSGAVYVTDETIEDWPPRQSGRLAGGPAGLPIAAVPPTP
jgi:DNA-directed RNA polymerase specialized sigma24 family protein